jgi:hypothetical protein
MTDITKLREYLEERRKSVRAEIDEVTDELAGMEARRDNLLSLLGELTAIWLEFCGEPPTPSPSEGEGPPPKPPSPKPPRESCADAIIEHYAGRNIPSPDSEAWEPEVVSAWNPRTVKASNRNSQDSPRGSRRARGA